MHNGKGVITEAKMVYTVYEVSQILGVNKNCVYNLINAGIIKTMKLGRQKITINSLLDFLDNYDGYDLTDLSNIKCIHEYKKMWLHVQTNPLLNINNGSSFEGAFSII